MEANHKKHPLCEYNASELIGKDIKLTNINSGQTITICDVDEIRVLHNFYGKTIYDIEYVGNDCGGIITGYIKRNIISILIDSYDCEIISEDKR